MMNTSVGKTYQNRRQSTRERASWVNRDNESVFQFADFRSEAASQQEVQKMVDHSPQVNSAIQMQTIIDSHTGLYSSPIQKNENNTGLPDGLKSGIEHLSGFSMNDVKVHYNSPKPAQLQALAYAQGTNIHLGSGQERHLPHEAWHVVQQKQGRVKTTTQLKGIGINDDTHLEHEADVMGQKALIAGQNTTGLQLETSTTSGQNAPIQRKLGFEVEVIMDLAKGRVATEQSPLLAAQRGYEDRGGGIRKGQTILSQGGWKLTPDGGDGNWYVEFITDAINETASPDRLPEIMANMSTYVTDNFNGLNAGQYVQLPGNFVAGRHRHQGALNLRGNIHITGGVRPDQLFSLLRTMQTWDGGADRPHVDGSVRDDLNTATTAAAAASDDPKYRGLVALLGSYISGQWSVLTKCDDIKYAMHQAAGGEGILSDVDYCVDGDDIREFALTGAVTDATALRNVERTYGHDTARFYRDLRRVVAQFSISTAKLAVPLLSRSSLATLRNQVTINNAEALLRSVMTASGLGWARRNSPLFPLGLGVAGPSARTIENNADITISTWVNGILDGTNLTFSDTTYNFESVGPATGRRFFCLCSTYEQGAVMEIRALDRPIPPGDWEDFATGMVTVFRTLNAIDD